MAPYPNPRPDPCGKPKFGTVAVDDGKAEEEKKKTNRLAAQRERVGYPFLLTLYGYVSPRSFWSDTEEGAPSQ